MKAVLIVFALLVYIFLGALNIMDAVWHYKKERYFRFGLSCMLAFSMCTCILNLLID